MSLCDHNERANIKKMTIVYIMSLVTAMKTNKTEFINKDLNMFSGIKYKKENGSKIKEKDK